MEAKGSTSQEVYRVVRERILTLELPPNAAISENELAAELGVSRTPVREGLLKLREEGFVQAFPKMGTFVAPVDESRVRLAQFIREAIECTSLASLDPAALVADELEGLRANLTSQYDAAERSSVDDFLRLDEVFHQTLLRLAGHDQAWPLVLAEKAHLDRARRIGIGFHPLPFLVGQHDAILASAVAGDLDAALDVMRDHLQLILGDLARLRETDADLFTPRPMRPVRRTVTRMEPS